MNIRGFAVWSISSIKRGSIKEKLFDMRRVDGTFVTVFGNPEETEADICFLVSKTVLRKKAIIALIFWCYA